MTCMGCGNSKAIRTASRFVTAENGERVNLETCDHCDGRSLDTGVPVDAAGQPISFPTGGFYSVAVGDRYWSNKRDFVSYVKKNGLVARPDIAMGRKNQNGLRNAPKSRR